MKTNLRLWFLSRTVIHRMRNISNNLCGENHNTYFMSNILFFFLEKRTVYEIMWKYSVKRGRPQMPQMTTWCMHPVCWIPEATNTNSGYEIVIACKLQHLLH